jgi:ornithine cyclodeaminase/alanine dehydrogenase-like protein (mu-crystallin family)
MRPIQHLDHAATLAALPTEALCAALNAVLAAVRAGTAHCPVRTATPLPGDAVLLSMPAADAQLAVVKLVTVHPGNPAQGLPAVQAHVSVLSATTGERLAELDGEAVTARRTAALSLVALRHARPALAQQAGLRLLVLGGGVQALAHLDVFGEGLQLGETRQITRQGQPTLEVSADHLAWADVIVCATSSATPLFSGAASAAVRPHAVVCAVGAYNPRMAELPPELVRHCHWVADTLAGCRSEAGDLLQAGVSFEGGLDLAAISAPGWPGLDDSRPVVFKSVGSALWDLAAARCVLGAAAP